MEFDSAASKFVADGADNARIKSWERSDNAREFTGPGDHTGTALDEGEYHFERRDIACRGTGTPHVPAESPPTRTVFALALLNFIEEVRMHFNAPVNVEASFLCSAHKVSGACFLGEEEAHATGVAIDLAPATKSAASCAKLFASARSRAAEFNKDSTAVCGNPAWGEIPVGFERMSVRTRPAVQAKLEQDPPVALDPAEINDFVIHVSLEEGP